MTHVSGVNMEDIGSQVPASGGLEVYITHVKPPPLVAILNFQADLKQNPGNKSQNKDTSHNDTQKSLRLHTAETHW